MWHHAQAVMMLMMPPSPLQKKDGGFAKKCRVVIRHQIQENSPKYYAEFLFRHGASFKLHIFSYNSFTPFFLLLEFLMKTPNMWKKKRFVILFHISCKESSSHHNTCMPGPILLHTAWPSRSLGCSKYQNGQHHCFYQTDVQLEKSKK